MEKSSTNLPRKIEVEFQGIKYEINFPNPGQIIDIESKKSMYTSRQYGAMAQSNLISTNLALDYVESIAVFSTLIADLKKDLRVDNLFELDVLSMAEVVRQYKKVFVPWYNDWIILIQKETENTPEDKKDATE